MSVCRKHGLAGAYPGVLEGGQGLQIWSSQVGSRDAQQLWKMWALFFRLNIQSVSMYSGIRGCFWKNKLWLLHPPAAFSWWDNLHLRESYREHLEAPSRWIRQHYAIHPVLIALFLPRDLCNSSKGLPLRLSLFCLFLHSFILKACLSPVFVFFCVCVLFFGDVLLLGAVLAICSVYVSDTVTFSWWFRFQQAVPVQQWERLRCTCVVLHQRSHVLRCVLPMSW